MRMHLGMKVGLMGSAPTAEALGLAVLENSATWLASDNLTTDESELILAETVADWAALGSDPTPSLTTVDGRACYKLTAAAASSLHGIRVVPSAQISAPINGAAMQFEVLVHTGTEQYFLVAVLNGSTYSVVRIDTTDGTVSTVGSGVEATEGLSFDLGDGWWRFTVVIKMAPGNTGQIRLFLRQNSTWLGTGAETVYIAEPTLTIKTASQAVAPSGSTWTQSGGKALQPSVSTGVGGVEGVGGLFAETDVYLETAAELSDTTLSLAWVGHPGWLRNSFDPTSDDMIVWRAIDTTTGDKLEILLRNDGTYNRWAVRSTISAVPTTLTLTDRAASWATACVGVTISGGTLTWYVDGVEFAGGSLTIPSGIDTIRAGQMGGGAAGWNAVVTDVAAWNSALSQTQHNYVAHALLQRAGIPWGGWQVVWLAGQSNAGSAGNDYDALSYAGEIPAYITPYCYRAEYGAPGDSDPGEALAPQHKETVTETADAVFSAVLSQNRRWDVSGGIVALLSGRKLMVIATPANGCGLSPSTYSWDPDSDNVWTRMTDYLLLARGEVTGAVASTTFVWVHGENDAGTEEKALAYQGRLEAMIADIETKCGALSKVIVTSLSDNQTALDADNKAIVRAAQLAVGAALGAYIETNGFDVSVGGLHFSPVGKYQIGEAVAAVL